MIRRLASTPMRVLLRNSFIVLYVLAVALGAAGTVALTSVTDRLDVLAGNLQPLSARNASVLTDMVDAETGLRGFELTGQAAFLQPYNQGMAAYPPAMARAQALAQPYGQVSALLNAEQVAADHWISYAAPLTASAKAIPSLANDATGKALLDRFRAANTAVADALQAQITAARSGADTARGVGYAVIIALMVLTVAAGTYTGLRMLRRVVPPLESVTRAIMRLAGGEAQVSVVEEGTSELVALARAVKHLARQNDRRHRADRRRERLALLAANLAREVSEHLDPADLLPRCAGMIATAFDVDRVLLWLSDGAEAPELAAEWRTAGLPTLDQLVGPSRRATVMNGLLEELGDRPVLVCAEPASSETLRAFRDSFGAVTVVACRADVGEAGVVTAALLHGSEREWDADEVSALGTVVGDVGRAIRRAQIFGAERELVRQLEALDRAKADFVATVSHELRTPLTSVRGYIEMIRDGTVTDDEGRDRMLGIVERNTRRLQEIVDELLTVSRIEAGTLVAPSHAVALDPVLTRAAVTLGPQAAAAGVELDLTGVASGASVLGDPNQLEQIVLNLASNAVKFTPAGGRVALASRVGGMEVLLTVSDTGIGIPLEEQEQIGGRFFRASNATSNAIPGTGLGMRIVRGLVEHHRGALELLSAPGQGTTWTVRLPLVEETAANFSS